MQERRILNCLIDQSKIPSTAVQVTASNYTTVQGNVIYIPLNEVTQSSRESFIIKPVTGSNVYLDSIDGVEFINNRQYISNETYIYLPRYAGDSYDTYYIGRFTTQGSTWHQFGPVSTYGNTDFIYGAKYPEDAIYYSKIKFKQNIKVTGENSALNKYTIYIDTEN